MIQTLARPPFLCTPGAQGPLGRSARFRFPTSSSWLRAKSTAATGRVQSGDRQLRHRNLPATAIFAEPLIRLDAGQTGSRRLRAS
jgi:hypothetical protein